MKVRDALMTDDVALQTIRDEDDDIQESMADLGKVDNVTDEVFTLIIGNKDVGIW